MEKTGRTMRFLQKLLHPFIETVKQKVGKHIVHEHVRRFATTCRTLDLGCGQHSTFAADFSNRIGIDIVQASGVDVVADAQALPFVSDSFEQIICVEVLEHIAVPSRAASEMARVLQNDGRLVLTMPFVYPLHEAPHDYQRFTSYGLRRLFSPAFEIQEIRALYTEEQTLAILLQRIAYQRKNSSVGRFLYMLLAHLIFKFSFSTNAQRFQSSDHAVSGPFMTAGYLMVGQKVSHEPAAR
jgi:SAM-dependent methyltransferase